MKSWTSLDITWKTSNVAQTLNRYYPIEVYYNNPSTIYHYKFLSKYNLWYRNDTMTYNAFTFPSVQNKPTILNGSSMSDMSCLSPLQFPLSAAEWTQKKNKQTFRKQHVSKLHFPTIRENCFLKYFGYFVCKRSRRRLLIGKRRMENGLHFVCTNKHCCLQAAITNKILFSNFFQNLINVIIADFWKI